MLPANKNVTERASYFKNGVAQGIVSCYIIALIVGLLAETIMSKVLLCLGISIVAALITAIAQYYSAKEHWQGNDIQHQREEHRREQVAIRNIGIPDDMLQQLQDDLEEELRAVETELFDVAFEKSRTIMNSFYLFSGIATTAIIASMLLAFTANWFWIFTISMSFLKFGSEYWKQRETGFVSKTKRSLLATLVTIPLLALLYMLLLQVLK